MNLIEHFCEGPPQMYLEENFAKSPIMKKPQLLYFPGKSSQIFQEDCYNN